jgi:uncharacterized protein CbrC (UPF0167 family)
MLSPPLNRVTLQTGHILLVEFSNGRFGLWSADELIEKGRGSIQQLADVEFFRKFTASDSDISWPNGFRITGASLYRKMEKSGEFIRASQQFNMDAVRAVAAKTEQKFPTFKYHPDPIGTGVIGLTDLPCECCGRHTGLSYSGISYTAEGLAECMCPWCIADGTAGSRLSASFVDVHCSLLAHGKLVAPHIAEEIERRTPSYSTSQENPWLFHCDDGCEFHGVASAEDVADACAATKSSWETTFGHPWKEVSEGYQPGGSLIIFKFKCRQCGLILFHWDFG